MQEEYVQDLGIEGGSRVIWKDKKSADAFEEQEKAETIKEAKAKKAKKDAALAAITEQEMLDEISAEMAELWHIK